MDQKSWLWRKKSIEKTITIGDKINISPTDDKDEKLMNDDNALVLERSVENLNEKLSLAISECDAKNELVRKHEKVAEEALAGWRKAKAEASSLKQELSESLQQLVAKDERIDQLDLALKECMKQLRFVREDQERRIHDVVTKTSKESERVQTVLEEKLAQMNNRIGKLNAENNNLSKVIFVKEKMVEELKELNSQAEEDFNALLGRLDSTEKTNASLKYELCMIEKELEIRNEEMEFTRRLADASQKQHLESSKKIAKLESECQKLRLLVQKRLPGPATLAKMKTEVEILGRDKATETRRMSSPPIGGLIVKNFPQNNSFTSPAKKDNYLIERLCAVEEENKSLKETILKKDEELQSLQIICMDRTSTLSQAEAESRISTQISELDHFKTEKPKGLSSNKSFVVSDMNLMDDFVEMEKLAIVSVDKSFGGSHVSDDNITPKGTGMELVPVYPEPIESSLSKSLHKLIQLIEGISNQSSIRNDGSSFPYENAETSSDYMVRVFQWKSSELGSVLSRFSHTCIDLLNGKTDLEQFARELVSSFDWVMNHCFSLQDVSSMRDTIKKHFDWDESRSENELGFGMNSSVSEAEKNQSVMEEIQSNLREDNNILKEELAKMELVKRDLEVSINSATDKIEELMNQLQESEKRNATLQIELESSKESKGKIEKQIEVYKLHDCDIKNQLSVARFKLSEARQKFSSLELELEERSKCCEELETTCLELQLQLESMTKKEFRQCSTDQEERELQTNWEISAASKKLAECQETILNLGKQLKVLASPTNSAMSDKVISMNPVSATTTATPRTTTTIKKKLTNQRSSLLDQMLAEDDAGVEDDPKSPTMKEIICTTDSQKRPAYPSKNLTASYNPIISSSRRFITSKGTNYNSNTTAEMSMAILPVKKRGSGVGFLKKLLSRRRKTGSNKMSSPTFP